MNDDPINAKDVSVDQVQLLREDCLIRAIPAEEVLSSGLIVSQRTAETMVGGVFYGVVVAHGPGALVEKAKPEKAIAAWICEHLDLTGSAYDGAENPKAVCHTVARAELEADLRRDLVERKTVPPTWKAGDHVAVRQGFGPEVEFREGRHHIVGRGNSEYGHGILAAWEPGHVHCWHANEAHFDRPDSYPYAECACGEMRSMMSDLPTRLPACSRCPEGPRLAEAKPAHVVYRANLGYVEPTTPGFEPIAGVRAAGGEERPTEEP